MTANNTPAVILELVAILMIHVAPDLIRR